jgi:TatD DNase family protein
MPRFIDTHCHPQYFVSQKNEGEVSSLDKKAAQDFLASCFESLDSILMVAITLDDFDLLKRISEINPQAHMSIGVHPCHVAEKSLSVQSELLNRYALDPSVRALGETGLDNYHTTQHTDLQESLFVEHLCCAAKTHKPVIVHTRSAGRRTLEILRSYKQTRGVIHCFTEDKDFARAVLDLGWMISFSGIITFPKSLELRDIVSYIPIDSMLIETDAPYLAPVPFRGKTNHPSYVAHVASCVATLRSLCLDSFAEQLQKNYQYFLNINC